MKAKIDMKKHGGKVKGAGDAPGDAAATGMPKSVAPDVISAPRAAHSGFGQNAYTGPSSLTPMDDSNKGVSPLAANIKAAGERGSDVVLDRVITQGTARVDTAISGQLRDISSNNVPDAFGMGSARSRQPTYPGPKGSMPATTAKSDAQPVRKPS
jgi:hypothetical protein